MTPGAEYFAARGGGPAPEPELRLAEKRPGDVWKVDEFAIAGWPIDVQLAGAGNHVVMAWSEQGDVHLRRIVVREGDGRGARRSTCRPAGCAATSRSP